MRGPAIISGLALITAGLLSGCSDSYDTVSRAAPAYEGVDTRLLEGGLVRFQVVMRGARNQEDVTAYAECAAAQYALIRDYGFARHLRTNVTEQGGLWRGDAVYTISAQLPRGLRTLDAEVVVAQCAENGIPTV
ncbi:MAG: hypothetical protein ACU0B7_04400 [Paracoccaceae bacterium]|uniref:hypothetical protein n=1 Tax=Seohaeicola saemankumensis TaxID=481181 RepID=UPI001E363112|nr:hypothetical protein [Seohaeicola saemankumensis]MCD1626390.1 hypothetical protein [Seohaeicola saemankumensis]